MTPPRIIFMGTPTFAVGALDHLHAAGIPIAAVVTAPDRPAGRGLVMKASAVKERALSMGLPVLQPERLRDPDFLRALDDLDASLYIVVAFRMLPEVVWRKPPLGTVNLHASLLPAYRGAAPINWAIIRGERRTGLTTFLIGAAIDTGDILLQEEIDIGPDETAGELHDRMMDVGGPLLVRTVKGLADGSLPPRPQPLMVDAPPAPKITPATCRLDLTCAAKQVHDLIRGMSPYPGAWCEWETPDGTRTHLKVLRSERGSPAFDIPPGTVRLMPDRIMVACADEWIAFTEVRPEGRRTMTAAELIRGLRSTGPFLVR